MDRTTIFAELDRLIAEATPEERPGLVVAPWRGVDTVTRDDLLATARDAPPEAARD